MKTWICDSFTEKEIEKVLVKVEEKVAKEFESSPHTKEEFITGIFINELKNQFSTLEVQLTSALNKKFGRNLFVKFSHEDVAATGPEKIWGADVGFYLKIDIPNYLNAERGVLVQIKKASLNIHGDSESRWDIDLLQLLVLMQRSVFSVYFLFGLYKTRRFIRVLPASYVYDICNSFYPIKRSIPATNLNGMSRKFSDFFLKDFLGNWWGDSDCRVIEVINGNDLYGVRNIIKIEIGDEELCNRLNDKNVCKY